MYTSDLPELQDSTVATFAGDTAILAVGAYNVEATGKSQVTVDRIQEWTKRWKIKLSGSKSVRVNFTNTRFENIPITVTNRGLPHANEANYLRMTLDGNPCEGEERS